MTTAKCSETVTNAELGTCPYRIFSFISKWSIGENPFEIKGKIRYLYNPMTTILVRDPLIASAILPLSKEFPGCDFVLTEPLADRHLPDDLWAKVDIVYSQHLSEAEFAKTQRLHWLHIPNAYTTHICYENIKADGTVLVTTTTSEATTQIGNFVLGAVLAFAKNLFAWQAATIKRETFEEPLLQPQMWGLPGRTHLQLGLGANGTAIAKQLLDQGLKVWGVQDPPTFHPFCHRVFPSSNLKSILPTADVISFCPSTQQQFQEWLADDLLALIKEDAIVIVLGGPVPVTDKDLATLSSLRRCRGILIDAHFSSPPAPSSQLWQIPNLILTPNVAESPSKPQEEAIRLFRKNLRLFLHGSFHSMRHLVSGQILLDSGS